MSAERTEERHTAERWALWNDANLISLLAWRLVRQRAEADGFNGLLASDLTKAGAALKAMLSDAA